jgi:hypothetical protein
MSGVSTARRDRRRGRARQLGSLAPDSMLGRRGPAEEQCFFFSSGPVDFGNLVRRTGEASSSLQEQFS